MADMVNNLQVPLAGWTVPRPVFKRLENVGTPAGLPVSLSRLKAHLRKTDSYEDDYLSDLIQSATETVENYTSRKLVPRQVRMWMDFLPGTGNEYTLYGAGTAQVPVRYANIGMFRWFELFGAPVSSWGSLEYIMNDGTIQTFDQALYIVDNVDPDMPARIVLQRGAVWPVDLQVAHALRSNYSLGYQYQFPAWAPSTAYAVGQQVLNGGSGYTCTVAGTSAASGGPAGNGGAIVDGGASWAYQDPAGAIPYSLRHAVLLCAAALYSNRGDASDQPLDVLSLPGIQAILGPQRRLQMATL